MDNNNNSGRDQFIINDPTGKIAIGESDAQREIIVSGVGSIPPNFETYWVDRATYQTALTDRLNANPMTEIVALGGFSKSSLAAWVHETVKGDFKKRVWVSFGQEPPKSFDQFARWVLQEIGFPNKELKTDEATLLRELLYRLNDPNTPVKTLVVMDQLEAILPGSGSANAQADDWQWFKQFLTKWAADGKGSRVLVTTRSRILTRDPIDLGGMNVAEGTVFFEREGLTGDRFAELIDLAGGHPLLLKLAATWTKETYGARVDDRAIDFFGKLFANYQDDPTKGVKEIFGVIFGALPIGLQDLLCGVSVYRLPFGEAMAQAIGPSATIEDLELLAALGLLLRQGEGFTLHPLVAELVRSCVSDEVRVAGHEGAIRYYSANFRKWDGTIESYRAELESFYHACELGQYGLAKAMLDRCVDMLYLTARWRLLFPLYERLTNEWQTVDNAEAKNLAWSWIRLGNLKRSLGDYRFAITAYSYAQKVFEELDFGEGKASSLAGLGDTYFDMGDHLNATVAYAQALEIESEINKDIQNKFSGNDLANIDDARENYQLSIGFYQKALKIEWEIDDKRGVVSSLSNLGNAYDSLGDHRTAIDFYQKSLEVQREIGDRGGEAKSLGSLGKTHQALNKYEQAIDFYRESLKIKREIGDQWGEGALLFNIANALIKLDRQYQALLCFQEAQAIYKDLEIDYMVEQCKEAIRDLNQISGASQHQSTPPIIIITADRQDGWWEHTFPANKRKAPATQQFFSYFWQFAAGFALMLLIHWLKR